MAVILLILSGHNFGGFARKQEKTKKSHLSFWKEKKNFSFNGKAITSTVFPEFHSLLGGKIVLPETYLLKNKKQFELFSIFDWESEKPFFWFFVFNMRSKCEVRLFFCLDFGQQVLQKNKRETFFLSFFLLNCWSTNNLFRTSVRNSLAILAANQESFLMNRKIEKEYNGQLKTMWTTQKHRHNHTLTHT